MNTKKQKLKISFLMFNQIIIEVSHQVYHSMLIKWNITNNYYDKFFLFQLNMCHFYSFFSIFLRLFMKVTQWYFEYCNFVNILWINEPLNCSLVNPNTGRDYFGGKLHFLRVFFFLEWAVLTKLRADFSSSNQLYHSETVRNSIHG